MRLRDNGHTVEELTDPLADMKAQIRDWEDEFDVDEEDRRRCTSPAPFRSSNRPL
jgi:hypothetical protein